MPEYSSTTITPADSVKVPAMNGSTSGNFQLDALRNFILASKGQANGLASLDANGKLPAAQLPDLADDVLVYANYATFPASGTAGKLYIAADTNKIYRWDDSLGTPAYVYLKVDWTDLTDGTVTVKKAECDASGNTITSTYETKADANDLKNALTAVDHRVQNLEQAKGDYVAVDSDKGVITTPSGKGKWAVVEKLRGVSRVENNQVQNPSFGTGVLSPWTIVGGNATVNDNKVVVTSASLCALYQSIQIQKGHIYLLAVDIDSNNTNLTFGIYKDSSGYKVTTAFTGKKMLVLANIDGDVDGHNIDLRIRVNDSNSTTYTATNFIVKDLTLYFGSSVPTLAEIQTYYPWLLEPSDYGTTLVDSVYEGVRSKSRNLLDPSKLNSAGTWSDGKLTTTPSALFNATLTDGWADISFIPNTQYYLRAKLKVDSSVSSLRLQVNYTDGTTSSSSGVSGGGENYVYITTTSGKSVKNVLFNYSSGGSGTAIVSELIFNKSDSQDGTFTSYWTPNTLSLPTPITLRSAGTVAEMYYPETGEQTKPIGSYTFTGEEPISAWGSSYPNLFKVTVTNNAKRNNTTNFLSTRYMPYGALSGDRYTQNCIYTTSDNAFIINDIECTTVEQFRAKIANVPLYYELKEADPSTFVTPLIDNTLLTEAYGRMSTVQTGTMVDGSFDMGFITL